MGDGDDSFVFADDDDAAASLRLSQHLPVRCCNVGCWGLKLCGDSREHEHLKCKAGMSGRLTSDCWVLQRSGNRGRHGLGD